MNRSNKFIADYLFEKRPNKSQENIINYQQNKFTRIPKKNDEVNEIDSSNNLNISRNKFFLNDTIPTKVPAELEFVRYTNESSMNANVDEFYNSPTDTGTGKTKTLTNNILTTASNNDDEHCNNSAQKDAHNGLKSPENLNNVKDNANTTRTIFGVPLSAKDHEYTGCKPGGTDSNPYAYTDFPNKSVDGYNSGNKSSNFDTQEYNYDNTDRSFDNNYVNVYTLLGCEFNWNGGENNCLLTPIVSCEISANVTLRKNNMIVDPNDLASRLEYVIHYRWSRSSPRAVCFFHTFRVARYQCSVTLRCFCSDECFRRGFVQLKKFYLTNGKVQIPKQADEFSYGIPVKKVDPSYIEEMRDVDHEHFLLLYSSGLVFPNDAVTWTPISYLNDFVPTASDVGHQLCLDVAVETVGTSWTSYNVYSKKLDESNGNSDVASNNFYDNSCNSHIMPGCKYNDMYGNDGYNMSSGKDKLPDYDQTKGVDEMFLGADEAEWWRKFDAIKDKIPFKVHARLLTGCVIPIAPLIARRALIPTNVQEFEVVNQRLIHPGTPLAEALGIGLNYRIMCRMTRRNRHSNTVESQNCIKAIEDRMEQVRKERINVLTERMFLNWTQSSKPEPERVYQSITYSNDSFTVMTWNVLAEIYATPEAYPYSDLQTLNWNFRRDRILSEIITYSPDIVCLQEVQGDHFENFFAPALLRRGYEGLYKQKTSRLFRGGGRHKTGKFVCDGCATFFRVPKFHLLDHFGIEFARIVPPMSVSQENKPDKRTNKNNVALVLCLEQTAGNGYDHNDRNNNILVVANTHILANPEAPDVKIWQANTLTSVLTEYMSKATLYNKNHSCPINPPGLIVCGDFNSTPTSAVYELVTTGSCSYNHPELSDIEACKWLDSVKLGHSLRLVSSYSRANALREGVEHKYAGAAFEPEFTNYTHTYVGCLDYIFFDASVLEVVATLELITELQLLKESHELQLSDWALPSPQRPSDHFSLMARLEWKRR